MKNYFKILSVVLSMVFIFSSASLISANAEGEYVKPDKFIYGDVNQDGEVTVKDVTYIQKGLAEIHYVNAVQRFLADPDNEGFSIKNATAIQKYLAQYETETPWGEEILMASQDEFSKYVATENDFEDDCVIVVVKLKDKTPYTVQDFPECNLKSIELLADVPETKSQFYLLYLETPGRNNVLEFIKSLDYRANIDMKLAMPNYVYSIKF
ncbi:MAG: hypothetical protein E7532_00490 [Ruminococcaceae bacterium]|nr:hypothetical protein [Oscillospiraceae bacterium]